VISISGMPGLYKVLGQSKGGVIVESLIDKKRFPVFASSPISKLDDISIYTTSEEKPLKEVLAKIMEKENGGKCIESKTADEKTLRAYMESVVPEYDKERVHLSDLKKLFNWYNLLHTTGLLTAEETADSKDETVATDTKKAAVKKDVAQKQSVKSNAPKVKAQGVRKTGTA
jgi:hypothetical protein